MTQSKIVLKYYYFKLNKLTKLNLTSDLRKAKKLALIYGKLLKSLVIKGRLEVNIIYSNLVKKSGSITKFSFYSTTVNRATNY